MAFNGSGLYSRIFNWVDDRNADITITASRMDQEMDGFATGLSTALLKDGTQAATALIPFAKGINVAAPEPADPQNGDMWLSSDGLMIRLGAASICVLPIGKIVPWPGTSVPTGWLQLYGQNVSRTTYAKLFDQIGTTYGAGDGSTTFTLPDYRGRTPFGEDDMGGTAASRITAAVSGITGTTLGAVGGSQHLHTHTHAQNAHGHSVSDPTHAHSVNDPGHIHGMAYGPTPLAGGGSAMRVAGQGLPDSYTNNGTTGIGIFASGTGVSVVATTATNQNTGSGASQNMPPAIIQKWIIFAGA